MELVGPCFAEEKQQDMSLVGSFLCLDHDMRQAVTEGVITFWVRDKLQQKILSKVQTTRLEQKLRPGAASKLYGTANFCEAETYGKIGCAGPNAIKDRQRERCMDDARN